MQAFNTCDVKSKPARRIAAAAAAAGEYRLHWVRLEACIVPACSEHDTRLELSCTSVRLICGGALICWALRVRHEMADAAMQDHEHCRYLAAN